MGEDVRILKNKRQIEAAFISLLQKKDFHKITVQDICETALTGRSTFYSHYLDKYDLLEKIVNRYASMLEHAVEIRFSRSGIANIDQTLEDVYEVYAQHRNELGTLMKVHVPGGDLEESLENILYTRCLSFLQTEEIKSDVPAELMAKLYVVNVFILMNWILEHRTDPFVRKLAGELQFQFLQFIRK